MRAHDDFAYLSRLDKILPSLVAADPMRAFAQLSRALRRASADERSHHRDLVVSGMWRESIADTVRAELASDIDEGLIDRVVELGRLNLRQDPSRLVALLDALGRDPLARRIGTLLVSEAPEPEPEVVAGAILDSDQLQSWLGEYRALVARHFAHVGGDTRESFLDLVRRGPSRRGDDEYGADDRLGRLWRYRRLVPVAEHLTGTDAEALALLQREFGDVHEPSANDDKLWVGPTSPVSEEWLEGRSPSQVVAYLRNWQPPDGFFQDSPAGLSRRLEKVVERNAGVYAEEAGRFTEVHATYFRALITGLANAVSAGTTIGWGAVLSAGVAAVSKPRSEPGSIGGMDRTFDLGDADADWSWSRRELARLVSAATEKETSGFEVGDVADAWTIVQVAVEDPEPDPEYEERYGLQNLDWNTVALNTVRPVAIFAMFELWEWLATRDPGHSVLGEIRDKAASHLEPGVDRSRAVRATYGRKLPSMLSFDPTWLRDKLDQIFPTDPGNAELNWAAWAGYLAFWRPHREVFALLEGQYRWALERLAGVPDWKWLRDPIEAIGQHLVALYASGMIEFDEWLGPYFRAAPLEARRDVLSWIGRSTSSNPPEPDIAARLVELWERRLRAVEEEPNFPRAELEPVAWWFAGGQFDVDWSFRQLQTVLELGVNVDPDFVVVERLDALASGYPEPSVHSLLLLVDGVSQPWRILGWSEHLASILRTVLASDSARARDEARQVISLLALRHGRSDLLELIRRVDSAGDQHASGEPH